MILKTLAPKHPTLLAVARRFESLVTSVSAQQVNLAFAFATRSRLVRALVERFGPHRNLAAHYLLMGYMADRRATASRR